MVKPEAGMEIPDVLVFSNTDDGERTLTIKKVLRINLKF